MKKLIILILVLLCIYQPVLAAPVSTVIAPTYFLADLQDDTVLVDENTATNVMPGDFSKIMTAILAIEKFSPTDLLTFNQDSLLFYNSFGNIANAKEGYRMNVLQHLQNMLLLYSDASANALAIAHSGTIDDFTTSMNEKAIEIGLKDTIFSSPSGDDPNKVSKTTVKDLYLLAKYAFNLDLFKQIVDKETFELPPIKDGDSNRSFSSRNHLISKYTYSTYVYMAANGIMPSYSKDSASFIATAKKNSSQLISIIINSPDNKNFTVYKDAINLLEHGFNNFYPRQISQEDEILSQVKVFSGKDSEVMLTADITKKVLLPIGYDSSKLQKKLTAPDHIWAPVKKGQQFGIVEYFYDNKHVATLNLVAAKDVKFSILALVERIVLSRINSVFLFVMVLVIVAILILMYDSRKKKEDRKRRKKEIMKNIKK